MRAGDMGISIPLNPNDFVTNDPTGAMSGDLLHNNLSVGNDMYNSSGSYIYGGDSDIAYCVQGNCVFGTGVRVYFEFTFQDQDSSSDSTAQADGFTFFIINGSNNTKNSTGGAPASISMGELLGYGGPGRTDGSGLQPPKMAMEFDVFPNTGSGSICAAGSRKDAADNHMALMFWGNNNYGTTTCSGGGYENRYDDNVHGDGSGTNPVNSYGPSLTNCVSNPAQAQCGYYSTTKGTYNWLEDGQLHRFRIEVTRGTIPTAGTYTYNIKAWVDCGYNSNQGTFCPTSQLTAYQDLTTPYGLAPQINRTVSLAATDHQAFNTMLFGWGYSTGASTQTVRFQNFNIYFLRSPCGYGTNPTSASLSNATQSSNINVLATAGCAWTAASDPLKTWLTIASGSPGTGNGTVVYNVSANNCPLRTGNITIADQVFTVTQSGGTALAINTASLPSGRHNVAYTSTTITASGGSTPYSWSQSGLPTGLNINPSTGIISGTPTAVGLYNPTVTVTDSCPQTANSTYNNLRIKNDIYTITNNTGATIYRQSGGTCTTTNRITNGGTYSIAYNAAAVTFYQTRSGSNSCSGSNISISGASADAADVNYTGNVQINSAWSLIDN
jgi:hypothetical protein